ncbi:MAG: AAA family ATPase [Coprobacillaceae bacterium]
MNNQEKVIKMMGEVNRIILGKEELIEQVTAAFLASGHVLLEDVPGVGKTTMALAFSKAMGLESGRIQFTPDVLPSDLTGFYIYRKDIDEFVYKQGSVFCNLLLADEINRTSPKTQSALLEVMEEQQVTVDGVTKEVPNPFLVIATQNPLGSAGTQMLPSAQIDRFMICTTMGYPDFKSEIEIAKGMDSSTKIDKLDSVFSIEDFLEMQQEVQKIYIDDIVYDDIVYDYIVRLVTATRENPQIKEGASPRATISLVKMTQAICWLQGKEFVSPNDVAKQFKAVVQHRIELNINAQVKSLDKDTVINEIIENVEKPKIWK